MIEYLSGEVASLTPAAAVIDCGGVGYMLNISLTTYAALEARQGSAAKLLVHEVIRDDAWTLYGFAAERERELFRDLTGVSGVGPGMARMLLSSLSPAELELAISSGDHRALKAVKGVGAKTAERIIVDLRDKIRPDDTIEAGAEAMPTGAAYEEALAALVMLGFSRPDSQKALKKIFDEAPLTTVETAVKKALASIK